MSKRYTSDGKRKSSRVHARQQWTCLCGRTVWGNGGKTSHRRSCYTWRASEYVDLGRGLMGGEWDDAPSWIKDEQRARFEALRDELRSGGDRRDT